MFVFSVFQGISSVNCDSDFYHDVVLFISLPVTRQNVCCQRFIEEHAEFFCAHNLTSRNFKTRIIKQNTSLESKQQMSRQGLSGPAVVES